MSGRGAGSSTSKVWFGTGSSRGPGRALVEVALEAGDRVAATTAYEAATWAVAGFSSGPAHEIAPFGVKVTVLEPGGMRTDWAGSSMTVPQPSAVNLLIVSFLRGTDPTPDWNAFTG